MSGTILVTVESLRNDYLDFMPNTTEFLDNTYNNAYATYPSTIGSFQSILGGIYPDNVGVESNDNIATKINKNPKIGITTNVLTSEKYGYHNGYTNFTSFSDEGLNNKIGKIFPEGTIYNIASKTWGLFLDISYRFSEPDREFPRATEVISELKSTLNTTRNEEWFAWLHLMDTHHPYHSEVYSKDISRSEAYKITKKVMGQNGGTNYEEKRTKELYKQTVKQLDDDLQEL